MKASVLLFLSTPGSFAYACLNYVTVKSLIFNAQRGNLHRRRISLPLRYSDLLNNALKQVNLLGVIANKTAGERSR